MGDGSATYESAGAGNKFRKKLFRPEINEDPQNDSREAWWNEKNTSGASDLSNHQRGNCACISDISELEQTLKQMTFTRSEAKRLIALVHSRTMEESHQQVDEEEIASPAKLAKAYKGSTSKQNLKLINNSSTALLKTPTVLSQHLVTMENLPDELLINIFIRLLAKQLSQMRSVSKSWNSLLSQSSFIRSHLHRSIHNNDQILLVFYHHEESYSNFKPFAAFSCQSPHLELTDSIKLPVNPRPEYRNGITVIGSVNGLICSSYGDSIIHIWNPSLSAVLTLPPYSMPSNAHHSIATYFRFGFDPETNDYKVVKLTGLTGQSTFFIKWWLQIEIYSMRKGTWELITERFPSHITYILDSDYVCVHGHDGHLHWLCCTDEDLHPNTIVAFDLGSEKFREIPFPDSIKDHNRSNELGILCGKLCVTSQLGPDGVIEVWVLEEYGVAESWARHHVFSQFVGAICPFGFTSHNEYAIEDDGSLVLYDPFANKQKVLKGYCPEEYGVVKIVEYVDSLVWVAPDERYIGNGAGQN